MSNKIYSLTVVTIFLVIAVLYLSRILFGWTAVMGGWEVCYWLRIVNNVRTI